MQPPAHAGANAVSLSHTHTLSGLPQPASKAAHAAHALTSRSPLSNSGLPQPPQNVAPGGFRVPHGPRTPVSTFIVGCCTNVVGCRMTICGCGCVVGCTGGAAAFFSVFFLQHMQ